MISELTGNTFNEFPSESFIAETVGISMEDASDMIREYRIYGHHFSQESLRQRREFIRNFVEDVTIDDIRYVAVIYAKATCEDVRWAKCLGMDRMIVPFYHLEAARLGVALRSHMKMDEWIIMESKESLQLASELFYHRTEELPEEVQRRIGIDMLTYGNADSQDFAIEDATHLFDQFELPWLEDGKEMAQTHGYELPSDEEFNVLQARDAVAIFDTAANIGIWVRVIDVVGEWVYAASYCPQFGYYEDQPLRFERRHVTAIRFGDLVTA
jgi:hypothetical protein